MKVDLIQILQVFSIGMSLLGSIGGGGGQGVKFLHNSLHVIGIG